MGLVERTRNTLKVEVERLLDPSVGASSGQFRSTLLTLDQQWRQLGTSLKQTRNELEHAHKQLILRQAELSRWAHRHRLAAEATRADLTEIAAKELERAGGEVETWSARGDSLGDRLAGLTSAFEQMEEALRKVRHARTDPGSELPSPNANPGLKVLDDEDAVEQAFRHLELQALANRLDRPLP